MSRKFEKPEQYVFRSNNGEKFKLLAVSPHKTNPLCVLVVASHTTTSGAYKKDEVLLLQARAEGGLLLSTRVATSPKPLVFLIWDLVPWVTEQRHQQVHELIITATGENILINQFRDEVLVPQCRLSCGVPVTACVMQRWLPRIVYAGGAGAGKIDLIFNKSKIEINNVLQFPPWMKEDKKPCFLSIGCVENKSEVLLGDSEGKIYLFGVPQCTVATVGEKFTILRDMTVPFPVNALAVAPQGRGLSTLKVVAVGVSGNAAVLEVELTSGTPCRLSHLSEEVHEAAWCRHEELIYLTTLDNKCQLHHWTTNMSEEPGKWTPWTISLLEENGVKVSWSAADPHWLAYITHACVSLENMTELF